MAESLYSILMNMANNPKVLREATKKAQPKIRKDYDKNVRKAMVQYYLDTYDPLSYKRQEPSPLFLAYKTKTKLVYGGTMVEVVVNDSGVDIGGYYNSNSYYHDGEDDEDMKQNDSINDDSRNKWKMVSGIHNMTGRQYMLDIADLRKEYGENNGVVQGSWILENFENGIHPRTNGWPRKKYSKKMVYRPKKIKPTPLQMAEKYADKYFDLDTSHQYILTELDKMWEQMF